MTKSSSLHGSLVVSPSEEVNIAFREQELPSSMRYLTNQFRDGRLTPVTSSRDMINLEKIGSLPPEEQLKHLAKQLEHLVKILPTLDDENRQKLLAELPSEIQVKVKEIISALPTNRMGFI